jgi:hypothetical protein
LLAASISKHLTLDENVNLKLRSVEDTPSANNRLAQANLGKSY